MKDTKLLKKRHKKLKTENYPIKNRNKNDI